MSISGGQLNTYKETASVVIAMTLGQARPPKQAITSLDWVAGGGGEG